MQIIKDAYFDWIKENTIFSDALDAIEITSPFTDSLNENIVIYIEPNGLRFRITDSGHTLWSLESMGITFRKNSQKEKILYNLIRRLNIQISADSKELFILTDKNNLGRGIHSLIQGILSVSDSLWYGKRTIKNLFIEEVANYFNEHKELYDPFPDIEIQGKSKLSHRFDYLMNTANRSKKLVKVINNLDQTQLERTLLSWSDTNEQRKASYNNTVSMVALINDKDKEIAPHFIEAFYEYEIEPLGFSNKKKIQKSLSYTS